MVYRTGMARVRRVAGPLHILRRMRPPAKSLVASLLLVSVLAGPVALALADVDPASDVLLLQNVFVPYQPKVCTQLKDQLTSLAGKTKAAGYPLKVAIVGSRQDLGGAPQFFGNPQGYAKFLGQESASTAPMSERTFRRRQLLVVMPKGFGTYQVDPKAAAAAKTVSISSNADANALAKAAVLAAPKMATAAGHPVAADKPASGCTKKGTSFLVFLAPIVVLLIGGLLLRYGLRPRPHAETASADDRDRPRPRPRLGVTSRRARLGLLAAVVVIAVVAFVIAQPGSDNGTKTTSTGNTRTARTTVAPPTRITVKGGKPVGGVKKITVNKGDRCASWSPRTSRTRSTSTATTSRRTCPRAARSVRLPRQDRRQLRGRARAAGGADRIAAG